MNDPSLTICLPKKFIDGHHAEFSADDIRKAVSLILENPNIKCYGWNKQNLFRRLSKLLPSRTCILFFVVDIPDDDPTQLYIHLDDDQLLPLAALLEVIDNTSFSPTFLFLSCANYSKNIARINTIVKADSLFLSIADIADIKLQASIVCEISRWWGTRSIYHSSVTNKYVATLIQSFIRAVNDYSYSGRSITTINNMHRDEIAWNGGAIFLHNVDIDKFQTDAREEQYLDALKRLADASFLLRARHFSHNENIKSSNALFWFSEIPSNMIDFDWVKESRFAFEIWGSRTTTKHINFSPAPLSNITKESIQELIEEFVHIPSGIYHLGSSIDDGESEPNVIPIDFKIEYFEILKRPILERDWALLSDSKMTSENWNLPQVNVDVFQAMAFASQLEKALIYFGFISIDSKVLIPSEQQWEAAARGKEAYEYPWGNYFQIGLCNCDLTYGSRRTEPYFFSPKGDSPFGCQDMSGNVREWTRSYAGVEGVDWQTYDKKPVLKSIDNLEPADRLIVRGGSYSYDPACVKTWVRNTQLAHRSDSQTGFRVVIERTQNEHIN